MNRNRFVVGITIALAVVCIGCGNSKKPLIVGSKSSTEQIVLSEIVAQHLEKRLNIKVERRLNLGATPVVYQALVNGDISIYPEDTAAIESSILRERAAPDASIVLERVRGEMKRISNIDVLDPLGVENAWAVVVRSSEKAQTLSEAAQANPGWRLGSTHEFEERTDGMAQLNLYRLPMTAAPRSADSGFLYAALNKGELTMVASSATDGILARRQDWKILRDDQKVFWPSQTCLMIRTDVLTTEPHLKSALAELSGKFSTEAIRKLSAQVDIDHQQPSEVATAFLSTLH